MFLKTLASAGALAIVAVCGGTTVTQAATIDLGFIIDESGSVGQSNYESTIVALRNAIAQIPLATAAVSYRVGVISFGEVADVVAAPVVFDSAANKDGVLAALLDESVRNSIDGGTRQYNTPSGITGGTNYVAAFNTTHNAFIDAFGTLGNTSILNMATDGGWNTGGNPTTRAAQLRTQGWDVLSFEAIANTSTSDENFLAGIGFDSSGIGGCTISNTVPTANVLDNCFVIDVPSFAAFESTVLTKVQRTVIDTGGGDPSVVPLPAAAWMLLAGLGALFGLRRRQAA